MSTLPATTDRQRFFPLPAILALGALLGALLAFAYPRGALEARLLAAGRVDGLTIAYLQAWLRVEPGNADVEAALTRAYLSGQRLDDAERMLAQLDASPEPAARQRALAIRLALAQQRLYALAPNDPARIGPLRELDALLDRADRYTWDVNALGALATQARGLGDDALAARFYERLVARDPARASRWLAALATTRLGGGQYRAAADAWFALQARATTRAARRDAFIAGLKALQAGNDLADAMTAAQARIGELADDPDTLRFLSNLALAAGRPELAAQYVKRLMQVLGDAGRRPSARLAAYAATTRPRALVRDERVVETRTVRGVWLRAAWYRAPGRPARARWVDATGTVSVVRVATTAAPAASPTPPQVAAPASADDAAKPAAQASDYELAYKVFLANGDVAGAERIAHAALDRDPQSTSWRARLAQVAEWNHHPDVALRNYLALAQQRGDAGDWRQVERLAPGLDDQAAMLAVTLYEAGQHPADPKRLDAAVDAYERNADPDAALRFLHARFDGPLGRAARERYAQVAERKGDDDLALRTWRELERGYGPSADYALRIATLLYARTQFEGALAALRDAQAVAPPGNTDFWRFYAMLGASVQREHEAGAGYRALLAGGHLEPDDIESMIGFSERSPLDAGRIAEYGYRHGGTVRMLTQALYYYARARAWARGGALLASLSDAQRTEAEQSAAFLLARAQFERARGQQAAYGRDLARALALAPDSAEAQTSWLWYLAEHGDDAQLQAALRRYGRDGETDSTLWPPLVAGWLRLGDGRAALHYLRKQGADDARGPLWRLIFADALEQAGRADEAWRIRRQVWLALADRRRAPDAAPLPTAEADELRGRRVALATLFDNGDRARAVLIEMLRADRPDDQAPPDAPASGDLALLPPERQQAIRRERLLYSAIAREAAVTWAQAQGVPDLERAWLTRLYVVRSTRPVYAEAQLAIDTGDTVTLTRLLDTLPDLIPSQNRIDAQVLTGRLTDAQSTAYDALVRAPLDDALHAQARERLLSNAQSVTASARYSDQGPLRFNEETLTAGVRITPSQSVQLRYRERDQTADASVLPGVPRHERLLDAIYSHQGVADDQQVTIGRRNALRDLTTARVDGRQRLGSGLTLRYAVGYNQPATETAQLTVGGVKDLASLGLDYQFDPHWFGSGRYEYARFRGQDRSLLGDGHLIELSAGYKIKADYPDYTLRAVFTHGQYSNANGAPGAALAVLLPPGTPLTAAAFMPQTFTQGALLFSFGDDLPDTYSKGWRPMFSAGPLRDSRAGWTGQVQVGLAGSLFGGDQVLLYGLYQGASATHSTSVKELGARYRLLY
jgi:polysaccharide biosynthesis protein PelB